MGTKGPTDYAADAAPVPGILLHGRDRRAALSLACDGMMNGCPQGGEDAEAGMKGWRDARPVRALALSTGRSFSMFAPLIQRGSQRLGQVSGLRLMECYFWFVAPLSCAFNSAEIGASEAARTAARAGTDPQ